MLVKSSLPSSVATQVPPFLHGKQAELETGNGEWAAAALDMLSLNPACHWWARGSERGWAVCWVEGMASVT